MGLFNDWWRCSTVVCDVPSLAVGGVHSQSTAVEVNAIQGLDCVVHAVLIGELAEAESLRAASLTVVHQTDVGHLSGGGEEVAQIILGRIVGNIAHVDREALSLSLSSVRHL